MDFTIHSHCLDIGKHCALLHIIVEHFHFMTVAKGEEKMELVTVYLVTVGDSHCTGGILPFSGTLTL